MRGRILTPFHLLWQSYYDNRMTVSAQLLDIIADLAKAHHEDEVEDPQSTKAFLKQVSISSSYDETCHLFCVRWSLCYRPHLFLIKSPFPIPPFITKPVIFCLFCRSNYHWLLNISIFLKLVSSFVFSLAICFEHARTLFFLFFFHHFPYDLKAQYFL